MRLAIVRLSNPFNDLINFINVFGWILRGRSSMEDGFMGLLPVSIARAGTHIPILRPFSILQLHHLHEPGLVIPITGNGLCLQKKSVSEAIVSASESGEKSKKYHQPPLARRTRAWSFGVR